MPRAVEPKSGGETASTRRFVARIVLDPET
jgi:hypothetical protein